MHFKDWKGDPTEDIKGLLKEEIERSTKKDMGLDQIFLSQIKLHVDSINDQIQDLYAHIEALEKALGKQGS